MRTVALGSSGIEVTPICMGTWNMGQPQGWGPEDDAHSIDLIRYAIDRGCNFIDTARAYGRGRAERIVGEAIKGRRDGLILATKMMHCPSAMVSKHIDESLECMGVDMIDLYICHWPFPRHDLDAFFEAMAVERERGRIRAIGVSNFSTEQMALAMNYGVVSLQPPYSIVWRTEDSTLQFCRDHGIAVTPYSPLAQGLLTGRYTRSESEVTGVRQHNQLFSERVFPNALEAARAVDAVADKLGCTSAQAALAWLLRTDGVTSLVLGASSREQWQQNLGALDVDIPDADYAHLDRLGREVWELLGPDETMWGWKPD